MHLRNLVDRMAVRLCVGFYLEDFLTTTETQGQTPAVRGEELEDGRHLPHEGRLRTTFPRDPREGGAAASFACGTLGLQGRESAQRAA